MRKFFSGYCIALVVALAFANYRGYVFSSMFDSGAQANRIANHYHK